MKQIYDDPYQNYGATKITQIIKQNGEIIAEKTVGNYMRKMGLKAQYTKPYTTTTKDSNFSEELINILNEEFKSPNQYEIVYKEGLNKLYLIQYTK
nr:IS3 family transposase [Clostridium putrefaciens]